MRRVIWAASALRDLQGIRAYIGQFNPTAAQQMAGRLQVAGDSLGEMTDRGRSAGRYRELTAVWPYVLRYRPAGDQVLILRVRHGKQRPAP
jgi:toxin ParE1/3/4